MFLVTILNKLIIAINPWNFATIFHNLSQISKNLLQFFNSFKIVNKYIANMHRGHDVSAFFEHRQKHRGRCFFKTKCDVLRDVLGLGPQRQKWLGPTILMPL